MKSRILAVLLVISLGVNIGFLLHWLWPRSAARSTAGVLAGWHASPMKRGLGLNRKQTQLMEKERRQVLVQIAPLQDELRQKRRELFLLLKKKDMGDAGLDGALNEISRLQAAIEKIFILHSLKVRGHFTPAQMHKFEGYLERGLCPNMAAEAGCPPGKTPGRPACGDMTDDSK